MTTIESLEARVAALANALTELGLRLQHGGDPELKHAMRQWAGAWAVRWSRVLRDAPAPPAREPEPAASEWHVTLKQMGTHKPWCGRAHYLGDLVPCRCDQEPATVSGPSPSALKRAERLLASPSWQWSNRAECELYIAKAIDAHAKALAAELSATVRELARLFDERNAAQAEAGELKRRVAELEARAPSVDPEALARALVTASELSGAVQVKVAGREVASFYTNEPGFWPRARKEIGSWRSALAAAIRAALPECAKAEPDALVAELVKALDTDGNREQVFVANRRPTGRACEAMRKLWERETAKEGKRG